MPLDPTSQDFFGSEASQLPGTRRGFGTTATQNVAPLIPAPTPPPTAGGSLAPPPVPSASGGSVLGAPTLGVRSKIADSPVGPNQGIRLPTTQITAPPAPPPSRVGTSPTTPTTPAGPVNGDYQSWFANLVKGQPSSYALIRQLQPTLEANGVQVHYNLEGDPSKLILPNGHYISVVDQNGAWRWMDQGTPESNAAGAGLAPPVIPTTGGSGAPLDLSAVDAFTDPSTQFLSDFVKQYMAQLLGPVYSDQATAALKAGPMNSIEASRQAELRQAKESLGSMGVSPSSGVVAETLRQINAKYDSLRAQSDQQFATGAIARGDANRSQALSLAGLLADLPVQRLQVAEQAAGSGANPASLFSQLMNLGTNAQNAQLTQQQLQQQFQLGLGQILGSVASNFAKTGATT